MFYHEALTEAQTRARETNSMRYVWYNPNVFAMDWRTRYVCTNGVYLPTNTRVDAVSPDGTVKEYKGL